MADKPPTSTFRRAGYEFRRLWDLHRVRAGAAILNFGGVAAGLILGWHEDNLGLQVLISVGALAASAALSIAAVFLFSLAISSRKILADRVAVLEQTETAPAQQGPAPVYIQIVGDVRINSFEARSPSDVKKD